MRIRKDHSSGSQLVHMRRLGLRVALQHARPVIQIIDSDKKNIWLPVLPARVLSFTRLGCYAQ
jgi:hypothetical protein